MTIRYSMQASAQVTPFPNNRYLDGSQNDYSLLICDQYSPELYYNLARHFQITQYSPELDATDFDAGLLDCRGTEIVCPQQSSGNQPPVAFALVDENSFFPATSDSLSAPIQLITEAEINNGVLKLRMESCKRQRAQSVTQHAPAVKISNHELRQPLHAIGLFASSLEQELSNPAQKETLSKIMNSCSELNSLLNATFRQSKPSSNAKQTKRTEFIQSSIKIITPAQDKQVDLIPHPKVMLVDDDAAVLDATHLLLSGMDCDTYPAGNIAEALEILEELDELPDLLIVDYHLGNGITGDMAVKQICSAAGKHLPAILVSGSIDQIEEAQTNSDFFEVLSKPVDPTMLLSTINNAIASKSN